jgi:hypothetical protein
VEENPPKDQVNCCFAGIGRRASDKLEFPSSIFFFYGSHWYVWLPLVCCFCYPLLVKVVHSFQKKCSCSREEVKAEIYDPLWPLM